MNSTVRSILAAAIWLIPLSSWAFAHYFTYKYASNVPYWDAWEYVELITGERPVTLAAIWEQHNEHRIVWQTLFEIAWGRWMRWDQYLASFLPFVFLGAAYTLLVRRAVADRPWLSWPERALLAAALSLLLFTFRQHEHLVLDMLLCWGILALAMVLFAQGFARYMRGEGGRGRAAGLAALVAVATLSTGQGLAVNAFVLGAGALGLALRKPLPRGYWLLAAVSAALAAVYFVGYVKPPNHPPVSAVFARPSAAVDYAVTLLGAAFHWRFETAWRAGVVVAAGLAAIAAAVVWRERLDGVWRLVTEYALAPMAAVLLGAVVVGRSGFGPEQAVASRYVPFTLLLLAAMSLAALDLTRRGDTRLRVAALAVAVAALLPVWYANYRQALHEGWERREEMARWSTCARQSPTAVARCDGSRVYPHEDILVRRTALLRLHGLCFFAD